MPQPQRMQKSIEVDECAPAFKLAKINRKKGGVDARDIEDIEKQQNRIRSCK